MFGIIAVFLGIVFFIFSALILLVNKERVYALLSSEMVFKGALFFILYAISFSAINYFFGAKKEIAPQYDVVGAVQKEKPVYNLDISLLSKKNDPINNNDYVVCALKQGEIVFDKKSGCPLKYTYVNKFAPQDNQKIIAFDYTNNDEVVFSPLELIVNNTMPHQYIFTQNDIDDNNTELIFEANESNIVLRKKYTINKLNSAIHCNFSVVPKDEIQIIEKKILISAEFYNNQLHNYQSLYIPKNKKVAMTFYEPDKHNEKDALVFNKYNILASDFFVNAVLTHHDDMVPSYTIQNKKFLHTFIFFPETLVLAEDKKIEQSKTFEFTWYVGAKEFDALKSTDKLLGSISGYGLLSKLNEIILLVLTYIFNICKNFGLAIIIFALLLRLVFMPFTKTSVNSNQKRKDFGRKYKYIKEKYGDDKQRFYVEQQKLIQEFGFIPGGGSTLLIQFLQLPIMFGIQRLLNNSILLHNVPFVLWIKDISAPDPLYILPAIFGILFFIQVSQDATAQKKFAFLIFAILTCLLTAKMFSAGTLLYMVTGSIFSYLQARKIAK